MDVLKKIGILIILLAVVLGLLYVASNQTRKYTVETKPAEKAYIEPIIIEPTPAPMPVPPPAIPTPTRRPISLVPSHVYFWVNSIPVPDVINVDYNFIPLKKDRLKSFSGSFGPYFEDPRAHLTVLLCSEDLRVPSAPACENVDLSFRSEEGYVDFGTGYEEDEFIGYTARKDYFAYFIVKSNGETIAHSPKAAIRTVKD